MFHVKHFAIYTIDVSRETFYGFIYNFDSKIYL